MGAGGSISPTDFALIRAEYEAKKNDNLTDDQLLDHEPAIR